MNQHNNPPFAPNQRIVAKVNYGGYFQKGDELLAGDCSCCPSCGAWVVDIGKRKRELMGVWNDVCTCGFTLTVYSPEVILWFDAEYFAPIITKRDHSNAEIEQSILSIPIVEERSDVKKKEVAV